MLHLAVQSSCSGCPSHGRRHRRFLSMCTRSLACGSVLCVTQYCIGCPETSGCPENPSPVLEGDARNSPEARQAGQQRSDQRNINRQAGGLAGCQIRSDSGTAPCLYLFPATARQAGYKYPLCCGLAGWVIRSDSGTLSCLYQFPATARQAGYKYRFHFAPRPGAIEVRERNEGLSQVTVHAAIRALNTWRD